MTLGKARIKDPTLAIISSLRVFLEDITKFSPLAGASSSLSDRDLEDMLTTTLELHMRGLEEIIWNLPEEIITKSCKWSWRSDWEMVPRCMLDPFEKKS
ncbi:hypothetical protein Trydic_g22437 [Trypoxylus dichotomus]